MNILGIETAFETLSFCIVQKETLVANYYSHCRRRNSKILIPTLDELLTNAGLTVEELDLIVVNQGPGSYTGVRIGMSLAKTLAQVHQIPLIGINALELLASLVDIDDEQRFHVLLNCTRSEVFHAEYMLQNRLPVEQTPIQLTTLEMLSAKLQTQPIFIKRIPQTPIPKPFDELECLPMRYPVPDAYPLIQLGKLQVQDSLQTSLHTIQPLYLKKAIEKTMNV